MKRMIDDYFDKFYNKLAKRHNLLMADNYKIAKEIAAWKENMVAHWDEIEVVKVEGPDLLANNLNVGDKFDIAVELDTKGLNDKGIGVELVAIRTSQHNNDKQEHLPVGLCRRNEIRPANVSAERTPPAPHGLLLRTLDLINIACSNAGYICIKKKT